MAALWLRPSTQARPHGQGQASSARLTRFDPLHAMQFRAPPPPQVRDRRPAQRPDSSDRDCPLVTAAYGTRVARPASRTRPPPGGDGSQIGQRVRPVLGEPPLVGKSPEGLAAAGWGDSNSNSPASPAPGQEAAGPVTLEFDDRSLTAPVRGLPFWPGPSADRREVTVGSPSAAWYLAAAACRTRRPMVTSQ
jgi:hypothetical protein